MSQIGQPNTFNGGAGNLPNLPAFLTVCTTAPSNVTGDGTFVTLGATASDTWITVFDQTNSLSGGTSAALTFTAPTTGKYHFSISILAVASAAYSSVEGRIVTSSTAHTFRSLVVFGSNIINAFYPATTNVLTDMTAGSTAIFTFAVTGTGTKLASYTAGSVGAPVTWISGYKVA